MYKPMIKRLVMIAVLICVSVGFSLSPNEIEPQCKLGDEGVVISWATDKPSGLAKLYWTYEQEAGFHLDAFPDYRGYQSNNKEIANSHQFVIPYKPDPKNRYKLPVELGKTIHYRVSCVAQETNGFRPLRSRDYVFRVIKDKQGQPCFGLVYIEQPIVANVIKDKAVISWETNLPASARFVYWEAGEKRSYVIETKEAQPRFQVLLEELKPDKKYFYYVESVNEKLADKISSRRAFFVSAPQQRRPFKFAVLGDSRGNHRTPDPDTALNGVNVSVQNKLCQLALEKGTSFIIHNGDVIGGYTPDLADVYLQYRTWKQATNPINAYIPFYLAMGNHDSSAPWGSKADKFLKQPEDIWADVFILPENAPAAEESLPTYSENVYSFDYGQVHFVCLNSDYYYKKDNSKLDKYGRTIDERQLGWLKWDLQNNQDKDFIMVYFHEPAYPTGGHYGGSLDWRPEMRDALWAILDQFKVDAVFCGHEHNYCRLRVDKQVNPRWKTPIYQIVCGRAGAPWYSQDKRVPWVNNVERFSTDCHFVLAQVEKSKVRFETYNIHGQLIDKFEIKKKKR